MHTPSQRLRAKVNLLRPNMEAAAAPFWTHPNLRELFPHYLCTLYKVIQASVPLLRLAADRCVERAASDPLSDALAGYFAQHAKEELDHDVWLLEDIESLGLERSDVIESAPSATVAALVGSQYYRVQHEHPVALLGYLAVIERPVDPEYYEQVSQRTRLPLSAFRTLAYHARVDSDHKRDLDLCIDALPLTGRHEGIMGSSAIVTAGGVATVFRDVVARGTLPRTDPAPRPTTVMAQPSSHADGHDG